MIHINKLKLNDFAEVATHSRCRAFAFESSFCWFEYHEKFSSNEKHPELELEGDKIQGTFHFVDDKSISDLWLVLTDFQERGIEFYTFWREAQNKIGEKDETFTTTEWIVWTPNEKFK